MSKRIYGFICFESEIKFITWQNNHPGYKVESVAPASSGKCVTLNNRSITEFESSVLVVYSFECRRVDGRDKPGFVVSLLQNPVLIWIRKMLMPGSYQVIWEKIKPYFIKVLK